VLQVDAVKKTSRGGRAARSTEIPWYLHAHETSKEFAFTRSKYFCNTSDLFQECACFQTLCNDTLVVPAAPWTGRPNAQHLPREASE
jgi:hypothetical protein